jgi:hypothetical protein
MVFLHAFSIVLYFVNNRELVPRPAPLKNIDSADINFMPFPID